MRFKPPQKVREEAEYSLYLKSIGFDGGTETGFKRAESFVHGEIDMKNLLMMRNWFARHIYTSRPGYLKWDSLGRPTLKEYKKKSRGAVAWLLWGGDPGYLWVKSKTSVLTKHYGKDYSLGALPK